MRTIHLYPFAPHGPHAGTLRLAMALDALPGELWCFEGHGGASRGTLDLSPSAAHHAPSSVFGRLKRAVFPSTLYECGRGAVRAFQDLELDADARVVLHTTYLAPLLPALRRRGARSVLDVYDLVWRAHLRDATVARPPISLVRHAYAGLVRKREQRLLALADVVLCAGWEDCCVLHAARIPAEWVPNGVPLLEALEPSTQSGVIRVGLLGNFAHSVTRDGARRLLTGPLGRGGTEIVFAGLGSQEFAGGDGRVRCLGVVDDVRDFYREVDLVVVPTLAGAGIKMKLAEGVLAGRPVVTTEIGAEGYPPALRKHFLLRAPDELSAADCSDYLRTYDREAALRAFGEVLAWPRAVARYAEAGGGGVV